MIATVFVTIVLQRSVTRLPLSEVRNRGENRRVAITGRTYVMTHAMRSSSQSRNCPERIHIFAIFAGLSFWRVSTRHTLRSLRIRCCPVATTLSSVLTALCLLSYPSSLLLWVWLACCGLKRFLFHRLQTGVALRLFPSTYTKPPNPSTCPSFLTTAPAPIPVLQR